MLEPERRQNLVAIVADSVGELKAAVDTAHEDFVENQCAVDAYRHLEDITLGVLRFTQTLSLLGYFEVMEDGHDPLA